MVAVFDKSNCNMENVRAASVCYNPNAPSLQHAICNQGLQFILTVVGWGGGRGGGRDGGLSFGNVHRSQRSLHHADGILDSHRGHTILAPKYTQQPTCLILRELQRLNLTVIVKIIAFSCVAAGFVHAHCDRNSGARREPEGAVTCCK